jgi:3-hydroxybutyryl-CoA dehydratase
MKGDVGMNDKKLSELEIGMQACFEVRLNQQMKDGFIAISGDNNPLHTNGEYAKAYNYKDEVAHGMLTSSFYSKLVGVYLPGKYSLLLGCNINYREPVYVGDLLSVQGEIVELHECVRCITVEANILNQNNVKVSNATVYVGLLA